MMLVSACLCGINCRYNGSGDSNPVFLELLKKGEIIPICPEQLGGLPTPRTAAEIVTYKGTDVISGQARVINKDGIDVSNEFIRGAYETLSIARSADIKCAVLKSRSPSCGVDQIYDGTFSSIIRSGDGVTAALLKQNGITVISDEQFLAKEGLIK